MRNQSWRGMAAALLGLLVAGTNAQTGTLSDLGTLLSGQKNLTSFYSYLTKYPTILLQLPSYNGVTILAPNNDAFDKLPFTALNVPFDQNQTDVIIAALEYHILQGARKAADLVPGTPEFLPTLLTNQSYTNITGGQRVENIEQAGDVVVFVSGLGSRSTLVDGDLEFNGGVVQIIDSFLIPPLNLTHTTTSFNLTSFQGALYASSEIDTFSSTPNTTIFAPNNEAFQALGGAISSMTVEELTTILDYHMLPTDVIYSTGLTNGTKFVTKQGGNITVTHIGNKVYINSAQLLTTDILVSNGVVHVIDNVLNPTSTGGQPNPTLATQIPVFASASSIRSVPFTSAIPCTSSCPVSSASGTGAATGTGAGSRATSTSSRSTGVSTGTSKAQAVAMARETGMGAAGLMAMIGGAVMMI